MKKLNVIFTLLFTILISASLNAQEETKKELVTPETATFEVLGSCGMCETRIEKAAKVEGVTEAEWNQDDNTLTVVYNPEITSKEIIQKSIAAVGHDTELFKAETVVYDALPGCCQYKRKE